MLHHAAACAAPAAVLRALGLARGASAGADAVPSRAASASAREKVELIGADADAAAATFANVDASAVDCLGETCLHKVLPATVGGCVGGRVRDGSGGVRSPSCRGGGARSGAGDCLPPLGAALTPASFGRRPCARAAARPRASSATRAPPPSAYASPYRTPYCSLRHPPPFPPTLIPTPYRTNAGGGDLPRSA